MAEKKKWIKKAFPPETKGKLHRNLNIPEDKKIPEKRLEKATHSKNPTIRKEAIAAETLKKLRKR